MIDVYNYLIEHSEFQSIQDKFCELNNGIQMKLTGDYRLILVPENESWDKDDYIYTYIVSAKFSKVMFQLFNNKNIYDINSIAHTYLPRKLRKDNAGCIGEGLANFEPNNNIGIFSNGGVDIPVEEFLEMAESMISKEKIFDVLFNSKFNDFFVVVECVWVYIYLCFEIGMSLFEILKSLEDPKVRIKAVQCKLKKEIDYKMLEVFKVAYDGVCSCPENKGVSTQS